MTAAAYRLPHFARIQIIRERTTALAKRPRAGCPSAAARVLGALVGDLAHEELCILAVNGQNHIVASATIAIGSASSCAVSVTQIVRAVLLLGVDAFILGHNHPSGDPTPSGDDVLLTNKASDAAKVCGLTLLDHVIVSDGGFASMLEMGLLKGDAS